MANEKSSTVDLLRHGAYVRFLYLRIAASIALQVQVVAVGWLMYERTRSGADRRLLHHRRGAGFDPALP
jgi:hypothetical protein